MVVSNSSSVHIDKLRGAENYATWKVEMKSCLNRDGAWKVVCGREVKKSGTNTTTANATTATTGTGASPSTPQHHPQQSQQQHRQHRQHRQQPQQLQYATSTSLPINPPTSPPPRKVTVLEDDVFDERNEIAFDTIVLGLTPPQQAHIAHCRDDGKTAWEIFERLYDASHAQKPTRLALRRQLYKSSPMDLGESIRDFINRKIAISEKLLDLGTLVDESELTDCILMDVADEYQGIVGVLERRGGYGLSDVRGALAQEELERRMRAVSTVENVDGKREGGVSTTAPPPPPSLPLPLPLPHHHPAPPMLLPPPKRPLLGMGADHAPVPTPIVRPGNVPIAIARQGSRGGKRPHQEDHDEEMTAGSPGQTSPISDALTFKKKANGGGSEEKEDFKKPRIGIRNGRKQKIQIRREPLPPPTSPSSTVATTTTATPQGRPFTCLFTFASCTQTFSSKNEWKRHINHIHLQLWYWRCDFSSCANRKAIFNRKDLFGQHLKRMHGPSNSNEIQERCKKERRKPPEHSTCGFCGRVFEGPGGWEAHVDHVGEHYTNGASSRDWKVDEAFVGWAVKEGVVQKGEGGALVQDPRGFPAD